MNPSKIKTLITLFISVAFLVCMLIINSCANQNSDAEAAGLKAPVYSNAVDYNKAEKGKVLFEKNCVTCHKFDSRSTGPALQGVTKRRTPDWLIEMIVNPAEMIENDATAKAMLQ